MPLFFHYTKFKKTSKYLPIQNGILFHFLPFVRCFRKPWLRVISVSFDISAKLSSTDYNEFNKPNPRSLAHIGSEKSLVELGIPENEVRKSLSTI